ncbi:MAG: CFI-box-CTERM domain-containing protein [Gemmatimonadales bacterium]
MTMFLQTDATGGGSGGVDPNQAMVDLAVIANGDTGLGFTLIPPNQQQVNYARTLGGTPPVRLDTLVNTAFTLGGNALSIVILAVKSNFALNDGTMITVVGGTSLPPSGSGAPGATLNNTTNCLVIYDTSQSNGQGYCAARLGTGGTLDLQTTNPVILYHELSHAFRIVTNASLALTAACNPSSPEENAAITDENDLRTQIAAVAGTTAVLRDPGIHCGSTCTGGSSNCCVIVTVASQSGISAEVQALRVLRDRVLRKSELGFTFFDRLFRAYYSFSPQVVSLMARNPNLRPLILDVYVRPLIRSLQMIQHLTIDRGNQESATALLREIVDPEGVTVQQVLVWKLLDGDRALLGETEAELAALLEARATGIPHIQWAMVEPVQMWFKAMEQLTAGASLETVGAWWKDRIDEWAPRVPIEPFWGVLTRAELEGELQVVREVLVTSRGGRRRFAERLAGAYPELPHVAEVAVRWSMGEET